MANTYKEAEFYANLACGRNPYALLDEIGAITRFCHDFEPEGLKGFATIVNGLLYCVINGNLTENDRRIIAGHEAAHLILHKQDILNSPACTIKDFSLYDNSGKLEFEANSFLADFLMSDKDVMDIVTDPDRDFFSAAKELQMPPPLLAFKLYSMIRRGYNLNNPALLQGGFLGRKGMW